MKKTLTGILSGLLLICVLMGNVLFAAYENGASLSTMVPAKAEVKTEEVRLPVLMYHHILKSSNRWGNYVISPQQFEQDLQYLKREGYTTVTAEQVLRFFMNQEELPPKPIMITFDDGYESFYEYAFSLLQKYDMKAAVMIIGKYTDLYSGNETQNISYSHVNWDQLREMMKSGLVEVGNHSYEMHQNQAGGRVGIKKRKGESDEAYKKALMEDVGSLNNEMVKELDIAPIAFAYPFGAFSKESDQILQELGFQVVFTCEEKVNVLRQGDYEPGELIKLKRFNRASRYSSEQIFGKFD